MIKTIAHLADVHYRNFQRHDEYRAICTNFLDRMKKLRPDRIVLAGDIVHSRNVISPELVNEVSWFLNECSKVTNIVIIIPGNHDIVEQNKDRMDAIQPIVNALDVKNIVFYTTSSVIEDDNVAWVIYSLYDNNATPDSVKENNYNGKLKIGLFHGVINGAENELGFKFMHGSDVERFEVCDIVLCGDIHKRQILTTHSGTKVIYPGSFIQQNFSETVSEHGFGVLTIDNGVMDYKFTDIDNPVKYLHFKIRDISDIEEGEEELMNA